MKHNNKFNKNIKKNNKPSYFDQNRDRFTHNQINPKEISNNTDKIIRDLIYGNIDVNKDRDLLFNPMIFSSIYNRVIFLYNYNWTCDIAISEYIQSHSMYGEIHPSFLQTQNIVKPKAEGYKILLDILEAFRLTSNIQLIQNIPLSLRQYKSCL